MRKGIGIMAILTLLTVSVIGVLSLRAADEADDFPQEKKAEASMPLNPSGQWSLERVLALSGAEVIELWKNAPAAQMRELDGHYMGLVPNAGDREQQASTGDYMYNQDSTRGYWLGKAYKAHSDTKGEGYNRWRFEGGKVVRNGRFGTEMGTSLIDGKPSLLMHYSAFNKDSTLIDEIRKLDDYIYLGVGTTETEDGKRSAPGHFMLIGPTDEWVGVDDES